MSTPMPNRRGGHSVADPVGGLSIAPTLPEPEERIEAMPAKPFHLGWFANFSADEWNQPFANGGLPWDGKFYVEMAQALERACFDFLMLEDKLCIPEAYGRSRKVYLKNAVGIAPKHDPVPLAVLIAAATSRIGVVATMSTMSYPPFLLARLCSTVDHIAGGRFGWNIVTSAEDLAARNFGLDQLPPRELRYEMADEYMELVYKLFESWGPDAVVRDRATSTYVDDRHVAPIDFEGRWFKCRGPLNTVRSPQGRPALLQAGGSPTGRDFAARHADAVICVANGPDDMRRLRADIRARAEHSGRDPDAVKIMFLVSPVLGETDAEARTRYDRLQARPDRIERSLALISAITDIDFSVYDPDRPLPERLVTNGEQGSLDNFQQWGSNKTLRQLVVDSSTGCLDLVGTPDDVADRMADAMAEVGGDGFLITMPGQGVSRRQIIEITDGLVPALQRRGVVRSRYAHSTLRQNLAGFGDGKED